MYKEVAYLIAEQLYENASAHSMCNRNWLFSIYKALLISNKDKNVEPNWTKYNQWNIDHNCRSAKAIVKKTHAKLIDIKPSKLNGEKVEFEVKFKRKGLACSEKYLYNRNAFDSSLWKTQNPKGETILTGIFERDELFNASISAGESDVEILKMSPERQNNNQRSTNKKEKGINQTEKEYARTMKYTALKNILDAVRKDYQNTEDAYQRSFMEVVLGAAIFYLPTSHEHFSGFISLDALNGYLQGNRKVKDHIYPRKLAARTLLAKQYSLEQLIDKYHTSLAQFMYVTSKENSLLVNYYDEHEDHDSALKAFQIIKFPKTAKEKFKSHKELTAFLTYLEGKKVKKASLQSMSDYLVEFRRKN